MNTSFDPLELVNTYGAFGTVGRQRFNVVFEGTDAATPGRERAIGSHIFTKVCRSRSISARRKSRRISCDSIGRCGSRRWARLTSIRGRCISSGNFCITIAARSVSSPPIRFPIAPPRYVRAMLYRYRFVRPNPAGTWWEREDLGPWLPPLSADDSRLQAILRAEHWLDEGAH